MRAYQQPIKKNIIATTTIQTPLGDMFCAATAKGICLLSFFNQKNLAKQIEKVKKFFDADVMPAHNKYFDCLQKELNEYFDKKRETFTVPLQLVGTSYQQSVWKILMAIPYGSTLSYLEEAKLLNQPKSARENGIEYLENYFDKIYEASDALSALKLYEQIKPDIIITDIQMPKLNGLEFIKRIRQKDKKIQVIVLSAYSHKDYLFAAIELQLVKYLIKPIKEKDFAEALSLCIESIENDSSNILTLSDDTVFDTYHQTLVKNGKICKLRVKELDLLTLLLKNKNRYVTYEEIENFVWKETAMSKDALKTVIKNLKTKIPKDLISNLSGTGYKIDG